MQYKCNIVYLNHLAGNCQSLEWDPIEQH